MNKEEIIALAEDAGFLIEEDTNGEPAIFCPINAEILALDDLLLAFAKALMAEQRERSAQVFLSNAKGCWTNQEMADYIRNDSL